MGEAVGMTPLAQPLAAHTRLAQPLAAHTRLAQLPLAQSPPRLEIVIPVHNDEGLLRATVTRLQRSLAVDLDVPFRLTIADCASSDSTPEVARSLARELPRVRYLRIEQTGRGHALRAAWAASDAEVVGYVDVSLSTDLVHLPALLEPLLAGQADIVVGSRLVPGAKPVRGPAHQLVSRAYNALLGVGLGVGFSDAACAFKAARREVIAQLLPMVEDGERFFDTELLYLARRNAFSVREIPVRWIGHNDPHVGMTRTTLDDLRGIARLRRRARHGRDLTGSPAARTVTAKGAAPRRPKLPAGVQAHHRRGDTSPAGSSGCHSGRSDRMPAAEALP